MVTFIAQNAANAFQSALNYLIQQFQPHAQSVLPNNLAQTVSQQIFCNAPTEVPLFRLFLTNSQNRAQGIPFAHHAVDALANLFHEWDYRQFAAEINGQPDPVGYLSASIAAYHRACVARGKPGIIGGNDAYHLAALGNPAAHSRNRWVRLTQTMTAAAQKFAAFAQFHGHNDRAIQLAWCNGINLPSIPLANLQANDLWYATDLLVRVPNIGRQLALNFLKDGGLEHCVKPDVHVRRVGGAAFRQNRDPYPNSEAGEKASVSACIALAQAIANSPEPLAPQISVAAVDRLLWLTGSGRLHFHVRQHPDLQEVRLPPNERAARIEVVAGIIRAAVPCASLDP